MKAKLSDISDVADKISGTPVCVETSQYPRSSTTELWWLSVDFCVFNIKGVSLSLPLTHAYACVCVCVCMCTCVRVCVRKCLLLFGAETFILQTAIQKFKY